MFCKLLAINEIPPPIDRGGVLYTHIVKCTALFRCMSLCKYKNLFSIEQ